ncbi:major urinary protein 20-like isoform X1 [Marmota monax]|uniref:major urinary protein 20-like isoform X1 n=1 Tax=Marmota monax TaxID=9995 RepID=UPI001EB07EE7|nr:major urinary protein 20-like isoform X1 [Marmota monax]
MPSVTICQIQSFHYGARTTQRHLSWLKLHRLQNTSEWMSVEHKGGMITQEAGMKLLLLSLGLTLIWAHTEGTHDAVTSDFDPSKYSGEWYSILLASDQKEKIEENGSMRVFVEYIHALNKSSLGFKFHIIINGVCAEIEFVCDKTEEDGVYSVEYDGHNTFKVLETDYDDYIIFHLINKNNGNTFQLMELYGRAPDVSSELKQKFVNVSEKYGIVKENILDLTTVDRCIQARGGTQS